MIQPPEKAKHGVGQPMKTEHIDLTSIKILHGSQPVNFSPKPLHQKVMRMANGLFMFRPGMMPVISVRSRRFLPF